MKEKIGIGIIGTGFARRTQTPAFLECEGVSIASVASGKLENAKAAAAEFAIGHWTGDWRETVSHTDVDLVCITTPPNLHREMALFAIEEGKHVLCEKPMAMSVAEAEEMTAAAAGKPLLALIDHELRFQPGRQLAYKMIRDGAIGAIRHAKAFFQAPQRGDPKLAWNWWSDAASGGGALGAINSHIIDSFNWMLGTQISSVFCQLQTHIKRRQDSDNNVRPVTTDDEANMLLHFTDSDLTHDATGLVSVSMAEYPKYQNRVEFYGTDGAIRIDHRGELFIAKPGEDDWNEIEVELGQNISGLIDSGFARGFLFFAPKIVDAVSSGHTAIEHAATFADGLEVQRILDAARESDRTGCRVTVIRTRDPCE
ncbi:MAG: Gfo/Idh/MocA family oxidoreductase [Pyrinomonadaceae bacterium]